MIYLDHAATTPLHPHALQAMLPYLQEQYANASSSYALGRTARNAIDRAKTQTASLIGAYANEIYVTSGGTEADNWAITGCMRAAYPEKRHMIVSAIEHHALLKTCAALEHEGFRVTYAPVNHHGVVEVDRLIRAIAPDTALISVMLANNEVGTIQPVREIAEAAHRKGCLMHTDAVQAVGHIPVDVHALNVDMLSLSAHKFRGPKGIGALYIKKGTRINSLIYGGEQEKGLRAGTENVAGIVGMGVAAEIASKDMASDAQHMLEMREMMIGLLQSELHGITINGIAAERLPGHVHITIDHADSSIILMMLDMQGIAASAGSACASGVFERSHVMTAMGITKDGQADLRFTLGVQNTRDDVMKTIAVLKSVLNQ